MTIDLFEIVIVLVKQRVKFRPGGSEVVNAEANEGTVGTVFLAPHFGRLIDTLVDPDFVGLAKFRHQTVFGGCHSFFFQAAHRFLFFVLFGAAGRIQKGSGENNHGK
ncbi:hypothetical protein DSECCO2_609140 [anaerobic digester metagenome]